MEDKNQYGLWRSMRDEEFQEQDVWDVLDGYEEDQSASEISHAKKPSFSSQRFHLSAPRVIPTTTTSGFGIRQHSAPVNVPDWSRIHRRKSKKAATSDDDDDDDDNGEDDDADDDGRGHYECDDDGCGESVSPEEYFRGRIRSPSFSVIEGVGRTLKGRDLSRVRNAVLKKTGFLE